MQGKIRSFVEGLSKIDRIPDSSAPFENPYQSKICRYNLEQYLRFLSAVHPQVFLVGEAPGYRGCQLTGIPFTDERQLLNPENFFALGDWKRPESTGNQQEASATVIWQGLRENGLIPLMWNAFPFHPYKEGDRQTNRTPNAREIVWGRETVYRLGQLMGIDPARIYAVGKKSLKQLGLDEKHYIRHPAQGGKAECLRALAKLAEQGKNGKRI